MHLCGFVNLSKNKALVHTLPPFPLCSTNVVWMCLCSIADYLAKSDEHMSRLADNVLDALTSGEHSRQLKETETVRNLTTHLFISMPKWMHDIPLQLYTA